MTTPPKSFLKSGHWPTLVAALLYFDVSFMVWVLLGPLAPFLREDLHLSATQQGLLVAIPLLGGSLFRPVLGMFGDRFGGKPTGLVGLVLTQVVLAAGWTLASATWHFYVLGFFLGIAGASFAVALPLASRWYPREYQGLAMGIAGAGNSGSLIAVLMAPRLAQAYGWSATFGIMLAPVAIVTLLFALMAKDSPRTGPRPSTADYGDVLRESDTLWFSFLYCLTFGGFVGFTSFLTTFFNQQYELSKVSAGDVTTLVVVSGSLLRPVGGWLADRLGGYRLLLMLMTGVAVCLAVTATLPALPIVVAALFVAVGLLGMGNGAVFQIVPQRFPDRIGIITGIVGAAGGLGGFFLPTLLGAAKDLTGSYASGLYVLTGLFLAGAWVLMELGTQWVVRWPPHALEQSGIFCYRTTFRRLLGQESMGGQV